MLSEVAGHLIGGGISLLSLFVKDWAQKVPLVTFLWPGAWDEWRKRRRTGESSDVEGPPTTDLAHHEFAHLRSAGDLQPSGEAKTSSHSTFNPVCSRSAVLH